MSDLPRGNLPPIDFANKSAVDIEAAIITTYESITGRTLAQGDPVRLFLLSVAAIIVNQRSIIDFAAKQNLLSYAQSTYIDYIGEGVGVERLDPQPAQTTQQFTLSAPQAGVFTVPAGTLVTNGTLNFATVEPLDIDAGDTVGTVTVECQTAGTAGNGLLPGQIKTLVNPIAFVESTSNTTTSQGGADEESDESLVERIRLAPASFSVAGPKDAYIFWSLTANQAIIDVAVSSPTPEDIKQIVYDVLNSNSVDPQVISDMETALDNADWPGTVDVRPLLTGGVLPGPEILDAVDSVLSADDIRPLTDYPIVSSPSASNYSLEVEYWIASENAAQLSTTQAAIVQSVEDYKLWQKTKIGRDINPDELIQRMKEAGAKRVNIVSPSFTVLDETQVAQDTSTTVSYQGLEDG